jgi:IS5 family transposase
MVGVTNDRAGNEPATAFTYVTPTGDSMIRLAYAQRSLVEVFLPDAEKLWDPVLRRIDGALEDEELLEVMRQALARRRPLSQRRGRPGTPATVALRMLVLKHLYDWSFDECEREVRANLVYRAFCRVEGERVPDAKTLVRLAHLLDGPVLRQILERLVTIARERRIVRGHRLRVDTTVVETNIHHPTDSTLLVDGVRVLTRTMKRIRHQVGTARVQVRDRLRSARRRLFSILQHTRTASVRGPRQGRAQSKTRIRQLYRRLLGITRATVREVVTVADQVRRARPDIRRRSVQLLDTVDLIRRVIDQTRARVFRGNTHHPDKVLSLFEPHTEVIRKGKAAKLTEFGKLVKLQEAEAQFITDYEVCATRVPDQTLWAPSLIRHEALFGRPPRLAVADGAFASTTNERAAHARGVRCVVLPRHRREGRSRAVRAALRWRTGCEGRISALKRRHGLRRCRYRGLPGMERWVGLGVIANNLLAMGRASPQTG